MSKQNRYPNGYLPKIAFHMASGNNDKVEYFVNRQIETYGPITPQQMVQVNQGVTEIKRQWEIEEQEFKSHLSYI